MTHAHTPVVIFVLRQSVHQARTYTHHRSDLKEHGAALLACRHTLRLLSVSSGLVSLCW